VVGFRCGKVENLGGRMRRMKKRGPHVLYDLNDLLFSLHYSGYLSTNKINLAGVYETSTLRHQ